MRRTNRDFSDRSVTVNFTDEMVMSTDGELDGFEDILREEARKVERSINGVVAVARGPKVVNIRCIWARDADGDRIRRMVQEIVSAAHRRRREDLQR